MRIRSPSQRLHVVYAPAEVIIRMHSRKPNGLILTNNIWVAIVASQQYYHYYLSYCPNKFDNYAQLTHMNTRSRQHEHLLPAAEVRTPVHAHLHGPIRYTNLNQKGNTKRRSKLLLKSYVHTRLVLSFYRI